MLVKKINELKEKNNLTNAKLSELSGVPLGTLNKITSGITTDPKIGTLKALAKVLNCSVDDFYNIYEPTTHTELAQDKLNLLNSYDKLNSIGKEEAYKRIDELTEISKYIVLERIDNALNEAIENISKAIETKNE